MNSHFSKKKYRTHRAVSDILGNILILAITVTLFSTLFYWVSTIPPPPSSVKTDFNANIVMSGTTLTTIEITDLGGSALYNSGTVIYISYEDAPQYNNHYTISDGFSSGATTWTPGMMWSYTVDVPNPGAVTISIIDTSKNIMLWSEQIIIGYTNIPPQFVSEGTTPASPITMGDGFVIWAKVTDPGASVSSVSVYIPYVTGGTTLSWNQDLQLWEGSFTAPTLSTNTTVNAIFTATGSNGLTSQIAFSITFVLGPKAPTPANLIIWSPPPTFQVTGWGDGYGGWGYVYWIGYNTAPINTDIYMENIGGSSAQNININVWFKFYSGGYFYYQCNCGEYGCSTCTGYSNGVWKWVWYYGSGSTQISPGGHSTYVFQFTPWGVGPDCGNAGCGYSYASYIYMWVAYSYTSANNGQTYYYNSGWQLVVEGAGVWY
jgi:FlaG/FlaF family flagellin (archaellin)